MKSEITKYYVTFGSDRAFPYPNGYMTIEAENEYHAREMFRAFFKNREGSDCLNFSFIYDQKEWDESCSRYYIGEKPSASMFFSSDSQLALIDIYDDCGSVTKDITSLCRAGFEVVSDDYLSELDKDEKGEEISL